MDATLAAPPAAFAWVGGARAPEALSALVPPLAAARAFPSWRDFQETLGECAEATMAFGSPETFAGLGSVHLPVPGIAVVIAGAPEELAGADLAGADLVIPLPPPPRAARQLAVLRKRMEFEAHAVRTARAGTQALESLAHDLRTPTTAIIAYAELAGEEAPAEMREDLRHIVESAEAIESLATQIIALSRAGERAVPLRPEVLAAADLMAAVLPIVGPACSAKGIALRTEVALDLPLLWIDRGAMRRVIVNIIENAIRLSPHGGTIEVRVAARGDSLLFQIADEGPGLAPEQLSRVFLRHESAQGRTGLGLAIAWELVTVHGGVIWAENRTAGGALFSLTVPTIRREQVLVQSPQATVAVRPSTEGIVVSFTGAIGREEGVRLRASLLAAAEEAPRVTLDFAECEELGSTALAVIFELILETRGRGKPCALAGVSPALKPVFEAARLVPTPVPAGEAP